jgi:hypothetical protein
MENAFSIREFLRSRGALLVHFSTIMARRLDLVFPADLHNAMTLRGVPLSFSTIEVGDTNPHVTGRGGAEGSIGLLVDLGAASRVISISPGDSGSVYEEDSREGGSLGLEPTPKNCADSIDKRAPSNEWVVRDYVPIGLYILPPIIVRQVPGEVKIGVDEAVAPFPDQPIYSANQNTFLKFNRPKRNWNRVGYEDIIPAVSRGQG